MPGNKPEFDLQPKAQEHLPEAAIEALAAASEHVPFNVEQLFAAAAATDAGHAPDDPHDLLALVTSRPGRAAEHVTFGEAEHGIDVTPPEADLPPQAPDWLDLG